MRLLISVSRMRALTLGMMSVLAMIDARAALAQGCVPSRFTSPALGAQGDIYLARGTWQMAFTYRGFNSNQFIVGHRVRNDLAPNGRPAIVKSQSLNTSLSYGLTNRLSFTLNAPLAMSSHDALYADGLGHENTAAGLGEMSVSMSYWLRSADALQPGGNVAVGVGVKAPTGRHDVRGKSWRADGSSIAFPVAQAIQLGDGGWGFIFNTKGFRPVGERTYVYGGGSYTINPRRTTDVLRTPGTSVFWSSPDTWDASGGANVLLSPRLGFSVSLGALFYGTPRQDLIGGRDQGARLPATAGYLSPGIGLIRGAHAMTFSVPIRVYMDFQTSYLDDAAGRPGGGGLSRRLILSSYSVRF